MLVQNGCRNQRNGHFLLSVLEMEEERLVEGGNLEVVQLLEYLAVGSEVEPC